MPWEPTQAMDFGIQEYVSDLEDSSKEVFNPAGYLIEISVSDKVQKTHIIGRPSTRYVIGRAYTCDLIIDKPSVSNRHASLEVENSILWITDEGSSNRTSIGDMIPTSTMENKYCKPGRAHQVNSKQFVTLGEVHLRYLNYQDYCAQIRADQSGAMNISNNQVDLDKPASFRESADAALRAVLENSAVFDGNNKGSSLEKTDILDKVGVDEHNDSNKSEAAMVDSDGFAVPHERTSKDSRDIEFSDDDDAALTQHFETNNCDIPATQKFEIDFSDVPATQLFDVCENEGSDKDNEIMETQVFDPFYTPGITQNKFKEKDVGIGDLCADTQPFNGDTKTSSLNPDTEECLQQSFATGVEYDSNSQETKSGENESFECPETQAFDAGFQFAATQAFDPGFQSDEEKEKWDYEDKDGSSLQSDPKEASSIKVQLDKEEGSSMYTKNIPHQGVESKGCTALAEVNIDEIQMEEPAEESLRLPETHQDGTSSATSTSLHIGLTANASETGVTSKCTNLDSVKLNEQEMMKSAEFDHPIDQTSKQTPKNLSELTPESHSLSSESNKVAVTVSVSPKSHVLHSKKCHLSLKGANFEEVLFGQGNPDNTEVQYASLKKSRKEIRTENEVDGKPEVLKSATHLEERKDGEFSEPEGEVLSNSHLIKVTGMSCVKNVMQTEKAMNEECAATQAFDPGFYLGEEEKKTYSDGDDQDGPCQENNAKEAGSNKLQTSNEKERSIPSKYISFQGVQRTECLAVDEVCVDEMQMEEVGEELKSIKCSEKEQNRSFLAASSSSTFDMSAEASVVGVIKETCVNESKCAIDESVQNSCMAQANLGDQGKLIEPVGLNRTEFDVPENQTTKPTLVHHCKVSPELPALSHESNKIPITVQASASPTIHKLLPSTKKHVSSVEANFEEDFVGKNSSADTEDRCAHGENSMDNVRRVKTVKEKSERFESSERLMEKILEKEEDFSKPGGGQLQNCHRVTDEALSCDKKLIQSQKALIETHSEEEILSFKSMPGRPYVDNGLGTESTDETLSFRGKDFQVVSSRVEPEVKQEVGRITNQITRSNTDMAPAPEQLESMTEERNAAGDDTKRKELSLCGKNDAEKTNVESTVLTMEQVDMGTSKNGQQFAILPKSECNKRKINTSPLQEINALNVASDKDILSLEGSMQNEENIEDMGIEPNVVCDKPSQPMPDSGSGELDSNILSKSENHEVPTAVDRRDDEKANPKTEDDTRVNSIGVVKKEQKPREKKKKTKPKKVKKKMSAQAKRTNRKAQGGRKSLKKARKAQNNNRKRQRIVVKKAKKMGSIRKQILVKPSKKKRRTSINGSVSKRKRRRPSLISSKHYILRTGYTNASENESLRRLGATILCKVDSKVTHLCMDKFRTTEKVLCGLAFCKKIVTNKWLTSCIKQGSFDVDEDKFKVKVDASLRKAEKQLGFKLSEVILKRNRKRNKLFSGLKLYLTRKVEPAFGNMFVAHGGKLSKTAGRKYSPNLIVVGLEDSDKEVCQLIKKRFKVKSTAWIKASIFRQKLPKASEFRISIKK